MITKITMIKVYFQCAKPWKGLCADPVDSAGEEAIGNRRVPCLQDFSSSKNPRRVVLNKRRTKIIGKIFSPQFPKSIH